MKKALLIVIAALTCATAWTEPVDAGRAASVAHNFWTHTLGERSDVQLQYMEWAYNAVHLFAAPSGGWVMVAADDVARPILSYSLHSTLDPQKLPVATADFLNIYTLEIQQARLEGLPRHEEWALLTNGHAMKDEEQAVGPLLTTTWYQTSPYNQQCPSGCMTGCEATAMAQVMKYWNYPAFGEGSHSYSDANGHGVQSADFANTRYEWDNMPNRLTSASTAAQKSAVATLMYHCGVAVDMSYSPSQSGAVMTSIVPGLTTYFHYSTAARLKAKGTMTNNEWTDTLIAELRHRRPMIYGGEGPMGGHVFVCDGFDARHYLHFNLGEDGAGDGYYQIGAINYGSYTFNSANDCVMEVQPEYGLYLNTHQIDFGRASSSQQVWVCTGDTCTDPCTAAATDSWITLSGGNFDHLGQFTVQVEANNTGTERTGTVTFTQGPLAATLTVVQSAYDPATDYCPLTVEMENTHNEPWAADAHLSFESTGGLVYGTARHTTNSGSSVAQVMVAPHDVMVRWHSGDGRDRYINYRIKNQYGETFVEVNNAFFDGADILLPWPCAHLGIGEQTPAIHYPLPYPNPTTGLLHIDAEGPVQAELLDLQGRVLIRTHSRTIDISHLPAGIYHLRTLTDDGTTMQKIVKQ